MYAYAVSWREERSYGNGNMSEKRKALFSESFQLASGMVYLADYGIQDCQHGGLLQSPDVSPWRLNFC